MTHIDWLAVPSTRHEGLIRLLDWLRGASRVAITCHVNADADAVGSEVGVAAWLEARGARVTLINPTPIPNNLRWLLHRPDLDLAAGSQAAARAIAEADRFLVLDTAEPKRIGSLAGHFPADRTWVLDHHVAGPESITVNEVRDPTAAATGEIVYDLLSLAGGTWPQASVMAIYVALVSDTGSFRFSNTTPRAHAVAADLIERGVDPERVYTRLFGTVPLSRVALLREALATLRKEPDAPITSILVTREMMARTGAGGDDVEGMSEHARSVQGTEVAVVLREADDGSTKVSWRSNGDTDVARLAREFGGGGHVKAAGATLRMAPAAALTAVLEATRRAIDPAAAR